MRPKAAVSKMWQQHFLETKSQKVSKILDRVDTAANAKKIKKFKIFHCLNERTIEKK
jgi:hypothetical protein